MTNKTQKLLALIMISALIISCSKDNAANHPNQFSAEMQSKFETALDKVIMENDIPGVIVGIWITGEGSWVKAKGVSNLTTNAPMKLANHFRMGSHTKTFTGTLVLQLADEKLVNLDLV